MTGRSYDFLLVFLLQKLPTFICIWTLPSLEAKYATQLWRLIYFLIVNQLEIVTKNVILRNKLLVAISTVNWQSTDIKDLFFQYFHFSYFYPFFRGKHKCSHAKSWYKVGKSTLIILSTRKRCQLWWKKTLFLPFSSQQAASSPSFGRKHTSQIRGKCTSKHLFRRRQLININKLLHQTFSYLEKNME